MWSGISLPDSCVGNAGAPATIPAWHYQQFDADFGRSVPAEGYGGWRKSEIPWDPDRSALVIMHAWDTGTRERFPGWHRAVEYIPRADRIAASTLPALLSAFRVSDRPRVHVAGGGDYARRCPGFRVSEAEPRADPLPPDDTIDRLRRFRAENVFVGLRNEADVRAGFARIDFPERLRPAPVEAVVDAAPALDAWCREREVRHLVYAGFALNWCLLMSPGGMIDMSRRGYVCSAVRDATTSVENKESAATEAHHEEALWRTALAFGFVFDSADLIRAVGGAAPE